jgi:hypothetical protein
VKLPADFTFDRKPTALSKSGYRKDEKRWTGEREVSCISSSSSQQQLEKLSSITHSPGKAASKEVIESKTPLLDPRK